MVGVGDTAISIGTDDPEVIDLLEPWRIDETAELVDYGVRLNRAGVVERGVKRDFPFLRNGSRDMARSRDPQVVIDSLSRILGSFERATQPGQVRLALMPLVRNGGALLVPEAQVADVPERWMHARGITRYVAVSTLVDAETPSVVIEPLLGSTDDPITVPLIGWWFFSHDPDQEFTPGGAVALAMGICEGKTEANAQQTLTSVARLVHRLAPGLAPLAQADLMAAIHATLP